jgi:hypothetical protein
MGLVKRSESTTVYLEVKHYRIWQGLEREVPGCDVVETTNPKTKQTVQKYGWGFAELTARATKIVRYDTEAKYATRYYGFKLHLVDDADGSQFVLDMPYHSGLLRKFLRIAPSIDWALPFTIQVWKGKTKEGQGAAETAILFRQSGDTVKWFFTREHANGMPEATQDGDTKEWDFRAQHRWLIEDLKSRTMPAIERAAAAHQSFMPESPKPQSEPEEIPWPAPIDDDDVPF